MMDIPRLETEADIHEREMVEEAESKPYSERTEQDWLYINMSPYGRGQGCHCGR